MKGAKRNALAKSYARGGLANKKYAWGDELTPAGKHMANIWQGHFPEIDKGEDGFKSRSPVGSFPPLNFIKDVKEFDRNLREAE